MARQSDNTFREPLAGLRQNPDLAPLRDYAPAEHGGVPVAAEIVGLPRCKVPNCGEFAAIDDVCRAHQAFATPKAQAKKKNVPAAKEVLPGGAKYDARDGIAVRMKKRVHVNCADIMDCHDAGSRAFDEGDVVRFRPDDPATKYKCKAAWFVENGLGRPA